MNIEIAEPYRMSQSGSSLLRLIQNNKTPILDLLVRESVQNSLDAHLPQAKYVTVDFLTGTFNSSELGKELEGITDALAEKFPEEKCQYIAVCDKNTVGLTGELDDKKVRNNKYGNLLKLVYEICKPQNAEGAGGSWGLGKTVYFRVGIGLVIYYSRICDENGNYSSRLAASFVEDETKEDAIIPEYQEMTRRGIAWWGKTIRENTTNPVTDEEYINKFLGIFGIKPYTDEEAGTIIIIPYINRDTLLANNRIDYTDVLDEHLSPYWYATLEDYLCVAVQRWYAPRLCNPDYPYGAYLKVLINGKGLSADSMEPVFKIVQSLYNRANHKTDEDFLSLNGAKSVVKEVKVNKFLSDSVAGNVACTKITRDVLGMDAPHNKPEPAVFLNCEVTDKTSNRPLVFFVRKPGMIVSYECISSWTAGIPSTNKNEYILGVFVLNSLDTFKDTDSPVTSLEEYVRKSEMADHTSWNDWTDSHFNPRIISKIQKSVTKAISNEYSAEDNDHKPKENSELSRYIGDLILPPDGYGNSANAKSRKQGDGKERKNQKKFSFSLNQSGIRFSYNTMTVPIELRTSGNKKIKNAAFEMQISSENGKIGIIEWVDELKLSVPFSINEIKIFINTLDGEKLNKTIEISSGNMCSNYEDIVFTMKSRNDVLYGIDIVSEKEHSMKIEFTVVVNLKEKNVRPLFVFDKEAK